MKPRRPRDPSFAERVFCIVLLAAALIVPGCTYYQARRPATRIPYEENVGREFAIEASGVLPLMDEPEVLDFVHALGHRISDNLVGSSNTYRFFVIRDPTLNAFAVPGGYIYIFAGLISRVSSVDELAGVVAHEIGHVEGNHFLRGQKKMDLANIATIAATILAAALGGGQEAVAVGTLAQAAQTTTALHYSRQFEREADRSSIALATKSGFDPNGIISMFHTFQAQYRLNAADLPPYFSTHPLPADRIYEVERWLQSVSLDENRKDPVRGFDLANLTARLRTENTEKALADMQAKASDNPDNARAQFLLGYLYLKRGDLSLALQHLEKARAMDQVVTDYSLYLARAWQLADKPKEAEALMKNVLAKEPGNLVAQLCYGDILVQLGECETALTHYNKALILNPESASAHTSMAMAYGRLDRRGESYYHLGMADKYAGRYLKALHYFKKASKLLPAKSKEGVAVREEITWIEG